MRGTAPLHPPIDCCIRFAAAHSTVQYPSGRLYRWSRWSGSHRTSAGWRSPRGVISMPPLSSPASFAATHATASSAAARHRRHAAGACRAICAAVIRAAASAPLLSVASLSSPPSFAATASARVASNRSRLADWLSHDFPRVMSQSIWPHRRPRGSTGRCRRSPKTHQWLLRHHGRPFAARGHISRANGYFSAARRTCVVGHITNIVSEKLANLIVMMEPEGHRW